MSAITLISFILWTCTILFGLRACISVYIAYWYNFTEKGMNKRNIDLICGREIKFRWFQAIIHFLLLLILLSLFEGWIYF